jgi:hypothetical protein
MENDRSAIQYANLNCEDIYYFTAVGEGSEREKGNNTEIVRSEA